MQCPSCRFENIPGLDACGRCGTLLAVGTAVIDVSPPRASRTAKRLRKVVPRRFFYQARDVAADAHRRLAGSVINDSRVPLPEPGVLSRLMVPGWAHLYAGLRLRAHIFFWAYVALLALGLLAWGTELGSLLLGLAFSVHASSIIDILLRQGTVRFPRMIATAAFVFAGLSILTYYPAGQVLMRVAAPIEYGTDVLPFKRLDVVLVNHWAFALSDPHRGDVVLFNPSSLTRRSEGPQLAHVRFAFEENQVIDRLIGLPGDQVVWDGGTLSVNGTAVSRVPLRPERLPKHLEISVPKDRYLIFPTTSIGAVDAGTPETFWKSASLIPRNDILGGVYLRLSPISRFWFIH
ncbi:MAG: S26 family signal peptidase [Isosphaeraceae bacterium]